MKILIFSLFYYGMLRISFLGDVVGKKGGKISLGKKKCLDCWIKDVSWYFCILLLISAQIVLNLWKYLPKEEQS